MRTTSLLRSSRLAQLTSLVVPKRGALAALATASVLCGLAETGILALIAQAAAALVKGSSQVAFTVGSLRIQAALGVWLTAAGVLVMIRLGLQVVVSVVPSQILADTQARLRSELLAAFTRASWNEQSRDGEGHLQELVTNQVVQANLGTAQAMNLIIAALTMLVLIVSAIALNVLAAFTVLLASAAMFRLLQPLNKLAARNAQALSGEFLSYAGGINEVVRLAEEIQVFGAAPAERQRSDALLVPVTRSIFRNFLLSRLVPGTYQVLVYLLVVAALGVLYAVGGGQVASLSAVVLVLVRAGMYGQQAQSGYLGVRQGLPFLERLEEATRRYADSAPATGHRRLDRVRTMAFDDVSFGYEPGASVLSEINFEVVAGETVGIVGPSGAGKSTVVQLLLGLRVPDSGRYLVNGVAAGEFKRHDWHNRFAYVPQEPRLLHASVADNIRFFRDLDDAAIERAARFAAIHDEVMGWSAGYETVVGPRADAISGGQQQRICLARALAAYPDVLVLDEPTSALDPHSEALIQQSLDALKHRLTVFLVAHRMSTLEVCERVMVVVHGRLEAFDSTDTVAARSAYYRSVSDTPGATSAVPMVIRGARSG